MPRHAPTLSDIEALARAALAGLPEPFATLAADVVLHVEEFPDEALMAALGGDDPFDLTGAYQGRSIAEGAVTGDMPPTVRLFRRPILDEWCAEGEALENLVAHIVIHEIAHHMGLDDDQIAAIEAE